MVQLADLYDADRYARDPVVQDLRGTVQAPHPLHGVNYADGALICVRSSCRSCREWRAQELPEECPRCEGSGRQDCPDCYGWGHLAGEDNVPCLNCDGSGSETCGKCGGTGEAT